MINRENSALVAYAIVIVSCITSQTSYTARLGLKGVGRLTPHVTLEQGARKTLQNTFCTPLQNVTSKSLSKRATTSSVKELAVAALKAPINPPGSKNLSSLFNQPNVPANIGIGSAFESSKQQEGIEFFNEEPSEISDDAAETILDMCNINPVEVADQAPEKVDLERGEDASLDSEPEKLSTTEIAQNEAAQEKAQEVSQELEKLADKIKAHQQELREQENVLENTQREEQAAQLEVSERNLAQQNAQQNVNAAQEVYAQLEAEAAQKAQEAELAEQQLRQAEQAEKIAQERALELAREQARAQAAVEAREQRIQELRAQIAAKEAEQQQQKELAQQTRGQEKNKLAQEIETQEKELLQIQNELFVAEQDHQTSMQNAEKLAQELAATSSNKEGLQDLQKDIDAQLEQIEQEQRKLADQIRLREEKVEAERQESIGTKIGSKAAQQSPTENKTDNRKEVDESIAKNIDQADKELPYEPAMVEKTRPNAVQQNQLPFEQPAIPISEEDVPFKGPALQTPSNKESQTNFALSLESESTPNDSDNEMVESDLKEPLIPDADKKTSATRTRPQKIKELSESEQTIKQTTSSLAKKPVQPRRVVIEDARIKLPQRSTNVRAREYIPDYTASYRPTWWPETSLRDTQNAGIPRSSDAQPVRNNVAELSSTSNESTQESADLSLEEPPFAAIPDSAPVANDNNFPESEFFYPVYQEDVDFTYPIYTEKSLSVSDQTKAQPNALPEKQSTASVSLPPSLPPYIPAAKSTAPQKILQPTRLPTSDEDDTQKTTGYPFGAYVVAALLGMSIVVPIGYLAVKKILQLAQRN